MFGTAFRAPRPESKPRYLWDAAERIKTDLHLEQEPDGPTRIRIDIFEEKPR
jgi:hypothetical protein